MKFTLLIFTTCLAVTFASPISPIKPPSFIESVSQLLYIHLNPIFQTTFQQLIELVFQLGDKLFHTIESRSTRSNPIKPAPWVSHMFGEMNSIATQWNNQVTQFFGSIPTIFENHGRSSFSFSTIKQKLHEMVGNFLEELKKLFLTNVNQLLTSICMKLNLIETIGRKREELPSDGLLNVFQLQVAGVFEKTKGDLNRSIDNAIDFLLTYWSDLKDRLLG